MQVCLVRPPSCSSVGCVSVDACPPIGLAYLAAALLEAGHQVEAIDAVGEALGRYCRLPGWPDGLIHGLTAAEIVCRIPAESLLIGVSVMFTQEWPSSRQVIREIREAFPDATIVVGGEHVTAAAAQVLQECPAIDCCVRGEGEATLVALAAALVSGEPLSEVSGVVTGAGVSPPRPRMREIDAIADPAWQLFPIERYIEGGVTHGINLGRTMPIMASRGCPYECTFCSSPAMWTTRWQARSPQRVLEEMRRYMARYGATNFDFYDLTAIVDKRWTVAFAELLLEAQLEITWQLPSGTRSEALDEQVLPLLKKSGCRHVIYAPESGSPRILKLIKKKIDPGRMLGSMRTAHRCGLGTKANIIIGFPGERKRDLLPTLRFILRMALVGVEDVSVFVFSPYPGTALFDQLERAGRIRIDEDYYRMLIGHFNPRDSVSFCEQMSDRFVRLAVFGLMASFYLLSFGLRPWRLMRLAYALFRGRPRTRLGHSLDKVIRKRSAFRSLAPEVA